jgi:hypothetical protein
MNPRAITGIAIVTVVALGLLLGTTQQANANDDAVKILGAVFNGIEAVVGAATPQHTYPSHNHHYTYPQYHVVPQPQYHFVPPSQSYIPLNRPPQHYYQPGDPNAQGFKRRSPFRYR